MESKVERRGFIKALVSGATVAVGLSPATPSAEGQVIAVSADAVRVLASLTGQNPSDEEAETIRRALERQFENIQKVRAYTVPQRTEPSLKFRIKP